MRDSRHPEMHVRWLIDPDRTDTTSTSVSNESELPQNYPFPVELGNGWFDSIKLANDMFVFQGNHKFKTNISGQLVSLGEFKSEFPESTMVVQTVHGGTICHREFHPKTELIYRPGFDFFRHADRLHVVPLIDSSSDSTMTSLFVSDSALVELIGEEAAKIIFSKLGLQKLPTVKVLPMPMHVSAPLRSCVSTTLTGALKNLFAQSKVLEYLCGLAIFVGVPDSTPSRTILNGNRTRELHDYLIQLEGKIPSIKDLASNYGMSANWLNKCFLQEYGQSIYSFITDYRLNQAHVALLEGNLQIKILSKKLGYSHVNHFTTAFRRKFGYPPGNLRK